MILESQRVQWWLAELDQYDNVRTMIDGAHPDYDGVVRANDTIRGMRKYQDKQYVAVRCEVREITPSTSTNLAHTIPADSITLGKGEPVFPALRLLLSDFPAVLKLINDREQYGIEKYGQTLMTTDDRDTDVEIANEQADTLAYIQKHILQHGYDDWIGDLLLRQIELCDEMLRYLDAFSAEEIEKSTEI